MAPTIDRIEAIWWADRMIAAPPLAGRRSELGAVLEAVTAPSPAGVVIMGEAGIGKSRLIAEAAARSEVPFLIGGCQRLTAGLPYLPFIDVLRETYDLDDGHVLESALRRCPEFVRVELTALIPDLGDGPSELDGSNEGWRRQRLFDSVRRLLSAVVAERRIVVVIEDLHWADPSTLELCDYLLAVGRCPVPLMLTCRADEADRDTLEMITNRAATCTVQLGPLTHAETTDQLIGLLGRPVRAASVDRIYQRAAGNAFFTEQLASAVTDQPDAALPTGLRALLLSRVENTGVDEQRVIAALAVAGRPLEQDTLAYVSGWPADRLDDILRALMGRRLVRPGPNGYVLRHALLGEAVLDELLERERTNLHRAMAEVLGAQADPSAAAEIADHFDAARCPAAELPWRVQAARHADSVLAPAEAFSLWRRVITLSEQVESPDLVGMTLPDVYWRACQSAALAGREYERRELAEAALTRCKSSATTAEQARMFFALGNSQVQDAPNRSFIAIREAIRLGDTLPPSRDHAMALFSLSQELLWQGQGDDPERFMLLQRALDVATRCDARGFVRLVRASMASAELTRGDRHTALKLVDEALELDVDPHDPQSVAAAASQVVFVLTSVAQYERAADIGLQTLALTSEHGYPAALDIVLIRGNTTECLQELGRVGEARALAAQGWTDEEPDDASIPSLPTMWTRVEWANLEFLAGDIEAALMTWGRCRASSDRFASPIFTRELAVVGVELLLWAGRPRDAVAEGMTALAACVDTSEAYDCGLLLSLTARAVADLAERGRAIKDAGTVRAALAGEVRLRDLLARCRTDPFEYREVGGRESCSARSWTAELTRLAGRSDPVAWDAAARGWAELGTPHRVAYSRFRQAEALLAHPHGRGAAAPLLREAARLAVEHVVLAAAIDHLADRAHLTFGPMRAQPHGATPERLAALTDRELAVLREIARGRTNTQIGADLYISAKTASVHVSNILRKLNVGSRVQAAAVAAQLGLLDRVDHD